MVARGVCVVAGGMHGCRGCAWLLGGLHGCGGTCVVVGGACMVAGVCMVVGVCKGEGAGAHVWLWGCMVAGGVVCRI